MRTYKVNGQALIFKQGLNVTDFLLLNKWQLDKETGKLLLEGCKRLWNEEQLEQVANKQVSNAKRQVKFKGGIFQTSVAVTYELGQAGVDDIELIQDWANKKMASAGKANENAKLAIERLEKVSAPAVAA